MNFENLTRNELIVIRRKSDESLLFFTKFWFRVLHGSKFIVNWHHEEICKELDKIENYELELLNINIPPRHSKTELAAVNKIARGIGMNPQSNWLYITASDELRSQTSVSIRDIVSHPYFKTMYGIELKKDQNAKNLWRTTQGGGLKTATIFGQITGFGAGQMIENHDVIDYVRTFEGAIILDDINKTDDSEVQNATSEKVTRTLFNTIFSRKNSKDTPIINIQQRVGKTDATAKLMDFYGEDNPKAKFMVYPVLIDGKPLWEFKHSLHDIYALRDGIDTAHVFATQYMQNPTIKHGALFNKVDLNFYDPKQVDYSESTGKLSFIDVADSGSDNHSVPIGDLIGNRIYIKDVVFTKEGTEINVDLTANILNKYKPEFCRIESNFGGGMYISLLQPKTHEDITLLSVKASTNKHSRIIQLSGFIKKYCYFRNDYEKGSDYDKFMENLFEYTQDGKAKHDDAPDSLEGLCSMARSFHGHLWE